MLETPAAKVIRLFGGAPKVAAIVGLSDVQVYRWDYPKAKGGHDGKVPGKHLLTLLTAAKDAGLDLTVADLSPELAEHLPAAE